MTKYVRLSGRCCGTCKHADFSPALTKHKSPRLPVDARAQCAWPIDLLALPDSLPPWRRAGIVPGYTGPESGATCPCWEVKP